MSTRDDVEDGEDFDFDVHDLAGQMNIVTDLSDEESIHDSDVEAQEEENEEDTEGSESESEMLTESDTDDDDSEMHEAAEGETDSDDEPDKDLDNPNIPDHDPIYSDDMDNSDDEDEAEADVEVIPKVSQRKKATPQRWLSEVRYYQSTTHLLIPKAPFHRLVREIAQDYKTHLEFTSECFDALQTASEDYLTTRFHEANLIAIHASRQTVQPNDIQMVRYMHDERA